MPIANCFISSECDISGNQIIDIWAKETGIASKEMTINFVTTDSQQGKQYKVMAYLYLPSIWRPSDISKLQIGLARTLAQSFSQTIDQVLVITTIINSGFVVESGEEQRW